MNGTRKPNAACLGCHVPAVSAIAHVVADPPTTHAMMTTTMAMVEVGHPTTSHHHHPGGSPAILPSCRGLNRRCVWCALSPHMYVLCSRHGNRGPVLSMLQATGPARIKLGGQVSC